MRRTRHVGLWEVLKERKVRVMCLSLARIIQRRDIIDTYHFRSIPRQFEGFSRAGKSQISLHGSLVPWSLARVLSLLGTGESRNLSAVVANDLPNGAGFQDF